MSIQAVKATRMELTRLKRKLVTARRGHKLLKDKRDGLIRQFLELVRKNYSIRKDVEEKVERSSRSFAMARALMPDQALETALLIGGAKAGVDLGKRNIVGINVPEYHLRAQSQSSAHRYPYGLAFTSGDLDLAVEGVSDILPLMLELAEIEKTCYILSYEIERTRRRVNALEHVVIPETQEQIRYIKMKLDENERSSQVRIMKVKDMILQKAHGYEMR